MLFAAEHFQTGFGTVTKQVISTGKRGSHPVLSAKSAKGSEFLTMQSGYYEAALLTIKMTAETDNTEGCGFTS